MFLIAREAAFDETQQMLDHIDQYDLEALQIAALAALLFLVPIAYAAGTERPPGS
ncbi:hypothetical protein GR927_35980 [Mycolicibacterium sp. 3033]|nr:hypothetical protein [Mycolicibacterium aurantiacum]